MADFKQGPLRYRYAEWQPAYTAAILERDPSKLKEKIHAAETALFNRAQQLNTAENDPERLAMRDAAQALRSLLVTVLGYPPLGRKDFGVFPPSEDQQ
jgi:hypothetical protein